MLFSTVTTTPVPAIFFKHALQDLCVEVFHKEPFVFVTVPNSFNNPSFQIFTSDLNVFKMRNNPNNTTAS